MLDEGFMAEARVKTVQQEREEVYAALQYAAFTVWWRNGKTVKNSSQSQNKSGISWTETRGIVRSDVLRSANIVA